MAVSRLALSPPQVLWASGHHIQLLLFGFQRNDPRQHGHSTLGVDHSWSERQESPNGSSGWTDSLCPGWGLVQAESQDRTGQGRLCLRPLRGAEVLQGGGRPWTEAPAVTRHLPKVIGEITGSLNHKKGSFKWDSISSQYVGGAANAA